MVWYFRPNRYDEKAREPIQGEFFSTEAIKNPAEALVREGIQNSLDAALRDDRGELRDTVRVRIVLATGREALPAKDVQPWLKRAWPHIEAEGNGLREQPTEADDCNYLLFEDFNTTGLTGDETAVDVKPRDRNAFYYFYRAEGRSGKGQQDRGRWGIGKHVFPRSSAISTFFGVTVRSDDKRQLLMGTCVLKTHDVDGIRYSPDAWFGQVQEGGPVLPIETNSQIDSFKRLFRISRSNETGLSLVVPFIDPAFTLDHIVEALEYRQPQRDRARARCTDTIKPTATSNCRRPQRG